MKMQFKNLSVVVFLNIIIAMNIHAQEQKFFYRENDYLTYEQHGFGSLNIVFLHGFGSSLNTWDEFYPLFDQSKFTLFLIDFKGFGHSSIPKDNKYSMIDNEEIICQFINTKISSDYILVGHSYGGGVSLLLSKNDKLIYSPKMLILLDCAAYNSDVPFFINYLKMPCINHLIYLFSTPKMRADFSLKRIVKRENYSQIILNRYTEAYKGKLKDYSFIKSAQQLIPINHGDYTQFYDSIKIPTLIIWGKQDKIISIEQGIRLSKQIVNSRFETIDNCGHIPQEEQPKETFNIVNSFIIQQKK